MIRNRTRNEIGGRERAKRMELLVGEPRLAL